MLGDHDHSSLNVNESCWTKSMQCLPFRTSETNLCFLKHRNKKESSKPVFLEILSKSHGKDCYVKKHMQVVYKKTQNYPSSLYAYY